MGDWVVSRTRPLRPACVRGMTNYDKVWVAWLLAMAGSFALLEGNAIHKGEDTLSTFTWKTAKAWPPLGVSYGLGVGFLAAHLFWPDEGLAKLKARMFISKVSDVSA